MCAEVRRTDAQGLARQPDPPQTIGPGAIAEGDGVMNGRRVDGLAIALLRSSDLGRPAASSWDVLWLDLGEEALRP